MPSTDMHLFTPPPDLPFSSQERAPGSVARVPECRDEKDDEMEHPGVLSVAELFLCASVGAQPLFWGGGFFSYSRSN